VASAYHVAERVEDRRTELTFDYAARGSVDHTGILAPDHAPKKANFRNRTFSATLQLPCERFVKSLHGDFAQ